MIEVIDDFTRVTQLTMPDGGQITVYLLYGTSPTEIDGSGARILTMPEHEALFRFAQEHLDFPTVTITVPLTGTPGELTKIVREFQGINGAPGKLMSEVFWVVTPSRYWYAYCMDEDS
jgi:hypothetical protein